MRLDIGSLWAAAAGLAVVVFAALMAKMYFTVCGTEVGGDEAAPLRQLLLGRARAGLPDLLLLMNVLFFAVAGILGPNVAALLDKRYADSEVDLLRSTQLVLNGVQCSWAFCMAVCVGGVFKGYVVRSRATSCLSDVFIAIIGACLILGSLGLLVIPFMSGISRLSQ